MLVEATQLIDPPLSPSLSLQGTPLLSTKTTLITYTLPPTRKLHRFVQIGVCKGYKM